MTFLTLKELIEMRKTTWLSKERKEMQNKKKQHNTKTIKQQDYVKNNTTLLLTY